MEVFSAITKASLREVNDRFNGITSFGVWIRKAMLSSSSGLGPM